MVKYFTKHNETVKTSATPESDHLFKNREDDFFLEDKQANIYLSFVYKALFSTNRASLDMHTAV